MQADTTTMFMNDLTVIDSSYLCEERGLIGESWIVDLELTGKLNDMSMVFDFSRVKKTAKAIIDQMVDHKLILPMDMQGVSIDTKGSQTTIDFYYQDTSLHVSSPSSAFCFLPSKSVNNQALIQYLEKHIQAALPDNVCSIHVSLRYEAIDGAYYHYTHGLKKHDGNCQRIAHGHRSKIEIYENNHRNQTLEKLIADKLEDIYLASTEDAIALDNTDFSPSVKNLSATHKAYAYAAEQGEFSIVLPLTQLKETPYDTTVECLAKFIAETVKAIKPESAIRIIAFEGVRKGAIYTL